MIHWHSTFLSTVWNTSQCPAKNAKECRSGDGSKPLNSDILAGSASVTPRFPQQRDSTGPARSRGVLLCLCSKAPPRTVKRPDLFHAAAAGFVIGFAAIQDEKRCYAEDDFVKGWRGYQKNPDINEWDYHPALLIFTFSRLISFNMNEWIRLDSLKSNESYYLVDLRLNENFL